jgi:uncharacterized membrane protein
VDARLAWKTRLFAAFIVLSNSFGNLFLSLGMHKAGEVSSVTDLLRAIFQPLVLVGISLLISWLLSRMAMLSWADLSYVLPVTALGYVITAVLGMLFQNEVITGQRWGGIALIVAGVVLVGSGDPHKESAK